MGNWRGDFWFCAGIHVFPIYLIEHAVVWISFLKKNPNNKRAYVLDLFQTLIIKQL